MNYNEHDLKMTLSFSSLVKSSLLSYESQSPLELQLVWGNVFRRGAHQLQNDLGDDGQQG